VASLLVEVQEGGADLGAGVRTSALGAGGAGRGGGHGLMCEPRKGMIAQRPAAGGGPVG
jgi:hypothetical protein